AGICAFESPVESDDDNEPDVQLHFMPRYDLSEIQQQFADVSHRLVIVVLAIVALGFIFAYVVQQIQADVAILGAVGEVALVLYLAHLIANAWELHHRMHALSSAKPREPDPNRDGIQAVQWGELLKAGFMPVPYKEKLIHGAWKLKGKPWR